MRKWPSSDGAINHPPAIEAEKVRALRTPFAHVHEKAPVGFLQPDFFSGVLDHSFLAGDWFERKNAAFRNARFFHTQRVGGETRIDFLADTPKMLRDLFVIRLNALRGVYGR